MTRALFLVLLLVAPAWADKFLSNDRYNFPGGIVVGREARCGDGQLNAAGEQCDPPGNTNQCPQGGVCTSSCACPNTATCGNNILEPGEQCDGAGVAQCAPGNVCTNCTCLQQPIAGPTCGNGTIETPEQCDPGGNACTGNPPGDPSCGQSGTCTASACVAVNGLCENGCTAACTCAPLTTSCPVSDFYVDPSNNPAASDSNAGTSIGAPLKTVTRAMTLIGPAGGKSVCINGGTSQETVTIPGNSITIQGVQGATLDGGTPYQSGWTLAPDAVIPSNTSVYTHDLPNGFDPGHVTYNGHYVVEVNPAWVAETRYCDGTAGFDQTRCWKTILSVGPRSCQDVISGSGCVYRNQWVGAQAMYAIVGSTIYLGFADGGSPNGRNVTFCGRQGRTAPWATISAVGKNNVVLRNLTVRGCDSAVYLGGGSGNVLDQVTARNGRRTIWALGTSNTLIKNSDVSIDYTNPMAASDFNHFNVWHVFRDNGIYPRTSIEVGSTGSGNEVSGNIVHDCFDGITDGDGSTFDAAHNVGFNVHDNVVTGCANDAYMARGGEVNAQWHDNRSWDTNQGFRIIVRNGPAYIYRNRIAQPEPSATQFLESHCFYIHQGDVGTLKLYHNSCSGQYGVVFGSTAATTGIPNYTITSNIFSTLGAASHFFSYSSWNAPTTPKPLWTKNWVSSGVEHQSWMSGDTVGNPLVRIWSANQLPTFQLPNPDITPSPRNCGIDVTTVDVATGRPWPGFSPGYYVLANPDCGWTQYAAPAATTSTTTTSSTTTTTLTSAPPVWTPTLGFWRMEQASNATRLNTSGIGAENDLLNNGTVAQEATLVQEGTFAASFISTENDFLSNATSTNMSPVSDFAVGCWVYPTGTGFDELLTRSNNDNGWRLAERPDGATSQILWQTFDGARTSGQRKCGCTTANGSVTLNTWQHVIGIESSDTAANGQTGFEMVFKDGIKEPCTFCDSGTTACVLTNGTCTRTGGLAVTVAPIASQPFEIGKRSDTATTQFDGTLDECFVTAWSNTVASDGQLDPVSACRVCSCGWRGEKCRCGQPASTYAAGGTGLNAACHNCTLPPCNQAQP